MTGAYVSESFWNADTFLTLLTLLFMFAAMCIPAIIAHRNNDKKQKRVSLVCGLTGMSLLIPWIVSVVQVSKKYEMPRKKDGAIAPGVYTLCSLVLIAIGGAILYRNYFRWGSTGGISLILYGVVLLVVSLLSGKGYWVGLMVAAPVLVSCLSLEFTETLYRLYEAAAIAGVLLIIYNVARLPISVGVTRQTIEEARSKWAQQTVLGVKEAKSKVTEKTAQLQDLKETECKNATIEDRGGAEKMKLERCPQGHFYDRAKYGDSCPYCAAAQQTDAAPKTAEPVPVKVAPTVKAAPAAEAPKQPAPPAQPRQEEPEENQEQKPELKPMERKSHQPVVGWLVCIKGVYRGESFTLKAGRNFIGRNADMDICLREDDSIADSKQAAIIYEPRSRQFILMPGDVHELCYINNEVALSSTSMEAYDVLDIGTTGLMLIPCCGKRFSWEDGLDREE